MLFSIIVEDGYGIPKNTEYNTIELTAIIAAPFCIICLAIMGVVFYFQHKKARKPPRWQDREENDTLMTEEQTIVGMIDEWSNSGSGSGDANSTVVLA